MEIDYLVGPFPSTHEYRAALEAIHNEMNLKQVQLLLNHYAAKNHTATAGQLAQSVGYKGYQGTNIQYGKLATTLCYELGREVNSDAVYILLTTDTPRAKGIDRPLTLRSEVVKAIEELGWKP